jgi:predicted nuclease with TOPRIM domain
MENGEETFASPTAAAADFEFSTNGGDGTPKLHNAADEIEALRAAKHDLEEKLDAVGHENRFLSSESRRLEVLVSQAREEVAAAEQAAATNESEAATLRAEVERLQGLLAAEKASHEEEMRRGAGLGDQLQTAYQEKAGLEEEIETLKGSAAADGKGGEEEECDSVAARAGTPKDEGVVLVAAAAAGAAATAAIAVVLLNLKR